MFPEQYIAAVWWSVLGSGRSGTEHPAVCGVDQNRYFAGKGAETFGENIGEIAPISSLQQQNADDHSQKERDQIAL